MPLPFRPSFCIAGLAAVTFAASSAAAQSWTGGIKGGFGTGTFTGHSEFDWKPAFSVLVFLNHQTNSRLSQEAEFGLSRAHGVSSAVPNSTTTFDADYLVLPLLLKLSLPGAFGLTPYALAGPNFSLRLDCSLDFITPGASSSTPCDNSSFSDRLDVGVAGSGGFAWKVRRTTLSVEARGSFNFRSTVVPLDSKGLRTWSWGVLLGASIPVRFRRAARIGLIPPAYVLVPISGTLPEALPTLPAIPAALVDTPSVRAPGASRGITVTAHDADARSLLIAIAREAGISMVVSSDVRRRVSVSLTNASADEAIAAIIAQAGLSIARSPQSAPSIVFYQLPVNVNQAPAETIMVRYGVSSELAKWIVENRLPKSGQP